MNKYNFTDPNHQCAIESVLQELGMLDNSSELAAKVYEHNIAPAFSSKHGNFKPHNRAEVRKAAIKVKAKRSETLRRSGWNEEFYGNPKYWEKIGSISHNNDQYFAGRNKSNDLSAKERRWFDRMAVEDDGGTMAAIYAEMDAAAEEAFRFHETNLNCVCDAISSAIIIAKAAAEADDLLHDELESAMIALCNVMQDLPQI